MSGKIPPQSAPCGPEYCSALFLEPQGPARIRAELGGPAPARSPSGQAAPHARGPALEPAVTEATSRTRDARAQRSLAEHSHQREPWHLPAPQLRRAAETAHRETPQSLDTTPNSKVQRLPHADWRHGVFSSRRVHTCTHTCVQINMRTRSYLHLCTHKHLLTHKPHTRCRTIGWGRP